MTAFRALLRSEYRKLVTTRMWWVLLIGMAAYMAFIAAVLAFSENADPSQSSGLADSAESAAALYTVVVAQGFVFPVIIGALSVTAEFRHRTITPTLLAEPRRTRLLLGKLVASVPVGVAYGIAGVAAGTLGGAVVLAATGHSTYLGDPAVLAALARAVLALTIWTMLGVALGVAIPHQVAVIVGLLVFTQFVQPMLRALLVAASDGRFAVVAKFLPGTAGESISGASIYDSLGLGGLLSWWQGALVLLAYVAVFALIGRVGTLRRDIA